MQFVYAYLRIKWLYYYIYNVTVNVDCISYQCAIRTVNCMYKQIISYKIFFLSNLLLGITVLAESDNYSQIFPLTKSSEITLTSIMVGTYPKKGNYIQYNNFRVGNLHPPKKVIVIYYVNCGSCTFETYVNWVPGIFEMYVNTKLRPGIFRFPVGCTI